MKKKRMITILAFILVAVLFAGIGAYAASTLGSKDDPLVTLSYVNERLYPQLLEKITQEADRAAEETRRSFTAGITTETYSIVTLSYGQKLTGQVGCEILLRSGSASAGSGIVDTTSGGELKSGSALSANHLCIVATEGGGITATANSVQLVVRGGYKIG